MRNGVAFGDGGNASNGFHFGRGALEEIDPVRVEVHVFWWAGNHLEFAYGKTGIEPQDLRLVFQADHLVREA